MARSIDYYFTLVSPWAYVGHRAFVAIAKKHGATIVYRPVDLGQVFPESGGMPLSQRHPLRVNYRMVELQRWREKLGLPFHLKPAHWPLQPVLVDCIVLVLARQGADVESFLPQAFSALFEQQRNLKDEAFVAELLEQGGHDGAAIIAAAKTQDIRSAYEDTTRTALAAGVFGSPSYVLDGEVFWGQDRLELLDDALTSGRKPFVVPPAVP